MKRRYKNLRDKETPSTHNDRKIMVVHGSGTKNKICCQEGGIAGTKKPPFGGFTTLLIALIILLLSQWYPEWDLNPHSANAEGF